MPSNEAVAPSVLPVPTTMHEVEEPHDEAASEEAPWGSSSSDQDVEVPEIVPSSAVATLAPPLMAYPTASHEVEEGHETDETSAVPATSTALHDDPEPLTATPEDAP